MNLKTIAAVSGKSGLFRVLQPTRNGVVLESLDGKKTKLIATMSHKVSILSEISMYTTDSEGAMNLAKVMDCVKEKHGVKADVNVNDNKALALFMEGVLPNYDKSRVYASDIKKLVTWFNIINEHAADVVNATEDEEEQA
ncbi:MAG: DUF5606 domain-containing protein [Thermoflexibacteraceae bacterium]|jgi:hypothetical protein